MIATDIGISGIERIRHEVIESDSGGLNPVIGPQVLLLHPIRRIERKRARRAQGGLING
jgi:hypothetical protein